jgi:hypothetical protein
MLNKWLISSQQVEVYSKMGDKFLTKIENPNNVAVRVH